MLTFKLLFPSRSVISEDSFLGFLSPEVSQMGLRPNLGDEPAEPVGWICGIGEKLTMCVSEPWIIKILRKQSITLGYETIEPIRNLLDF